jgi:hypothetical protein
MKNIDDITLEDAPIYLSDCKKLMIYKNYNNTYHFSFIIGNKNIVTDDILEAVVILIKMDNFKNDKILWDLDIQYSKNDLNIKFSDVLFWLLGGDTGMVKYKYKWGYMSDFFVKKYKRTLSSILKNSKNMNDVRKLLLKKIPMQSIYDFSIKMDFFN